MALIETLKDNFDDNSIDSSKWTGGVFSGGSIAETNKRIEMVTGLAGTDTSLYNDTSFPQTFSLIGSSIVNRLVNAGNQSLASLLVKACRWADGSSSIFFRITGGNISAMAGTTGAQGTVAYSSTNHQYLRIRESGGTTFWETSADGYTWNSFYSVANATHGVDLTARSFVEMAIESGVELSTTTVIFDDWNIYKYTDTLTFTDVVTLSLTAVFQNRLSDTIICTVAISQEIQTYKESLTDMIVCTVTCTDTLIQPAAPNTENLTFTIVSMMTETDLQAYRENLTDTIVCVITLNEVFIPAGGGAVFTEELTFTIVSVMTVSREIQTYKEIIPDTIFCDATANTNEIRKCSDVIVCTTTLVVVENRICSFTIVSVMTETEQKFTTENPTFMIICVPTISREKYSPQKEILSDTIVCLISLSIFQQSLTEILDLLINSVMEVSPEVYTGFVETPDTNTVWTEQALGSAIWTEQAPAAAGIWTEKRI